MTYRALVFDYDGTLALPRERLSSSVAAYLCQLWGEGYLIGILSGSEREKLEDNIIPQLPCWPEVAPQFFIQPTTGAALYAYDATGNAHCVYEEVMDAALRREVMQVLAGVVTEYPEWFPSEAIGERIIDRVTEVTFAALGEKAPLDQKLSWDADTEKRKALVEVLMPRLPNCEVSLGGSTSIDITKKTVHKGFGMERFLAHTHLAPTEVLYVGDTLYPGGTDYPVIETGVTTLSVTGPEDVLTMVPLQLGQ